MTTTPPAPTITVDIDPTPCPRVEIEITPMPGDAVTVTIWRNWAGQRFPVRGARDATVSGDFFIIDYEAPFGVPVVYTCTTGDVDGNPSLLSPNSDQALLDIEDTIWVQDPIDPTTAIPIPLMGDEMFLEASSFASVTYSVPSSGSVNQVIGSGMPVAYAGARQAASNMPLSVFTPDVDTTFAFRELMLQAYPFCMRTPARVSMLTGLTYVAAGDVTETLRIDGSTLWAMTGQAVRSPGVGVIISPRIYDDLLGEAGTYTELLALYATYTAVKRGS